MSACRLVWLPRLAALGAAAVLGAGCGSVRTSVALNQAEVELDAAREADAERLAPYEYASAEAWLTEARERQSRSDYERAIASAHRAQELASQALEKTGGGRDSPSANRRDRTLRPRQADDER